jgi:ubiquinone/menaquinone biosynthesis C-methylase UbiE/uncharacterized protein YbaR (Trm112 family)
MNSSLLQLLRCPFCGGKLTAGETKATAAYQEYGVLACHCGEYPVVAGIPILKKGVIESARQKADDVIELIRSGTYENALLSMVMPPPPPSSQLAPAWMRALPSTRGIGRLKEWCGRLALPRWRREATALLTDTQGEATACDIFKLYFLESRGAPKELYTYETFRYGQPRHLVGLSFTTLIQRPNRPVLDLACGFGHLTPALLERAGEQGVVGADRSFFDLYVAKKCFAPQAQYVCCEADAALPFPDGAFSVVFCSDAFHWFWYKQNCIQQLKRLTQDDGTILLVALRNGLVENHFYPGSLRPEEYQSFFADLPHRLLRNSDVLSRYLQKQGPPINHSLKSDDFANEPWLSLVASHRRDLCGEENAFDDWPHAQGRVTLNPLYKQENCNGHGNIGLRHVFPSVWYEHENRDCTMYEPQTVTIDAKILADLAEGKRTAEMEQYLDRCVLMGMPERFGRPDRSTERPQTTRMPKKYTG